MAQQRVTAQEQVWLDMTVEERAKALQALYLTSPGERVEDGNGVAWLQLETHNLAQLGAELSPLSVKAVKWVNTWMAQQDLRRSTGRGPAAVHYIRMPEETGSSTPETPTDADDEFEELADAAATEIVHLRKKLDDAEAEIQRLTAMVPDNGKKQRAAATLRSVLTSE